jgi:cytochrome oxidase Cu insertion factor (SCO1/SenC/PrrC family)
MALGVILLAVWGIRVYQLRPSPRFLKPAMSAPDFSFTTQEGHPFSSSELKGKVWVADFIFTRCAGTCPMLSTQMRFLAKEWKGREELKLVTFTVDPDYDQVPVMAQYAQRFGADPQQWIFLTGTKKDLYAMIRQGFKLSASPDPQAVPGFEFIHTTRMVLMDREGNIRGLYEGDDDRDIQYLHRDLRYLLTAWGKG